MKRVSQCGVLALITLTLFPLTADAFGRRPSRPEVTQSQAQLGPLSEVTQNQNQNDLNGRPPQSVPGPSSILLVSVGLALMVMFANTKRRSAGTGSRGSW